MGSKSHTTDVPEGTERFNGMIVHAEERCNPPCPIHAPSDHRMKDWRLYWRGDRGIFERICEHGVGHPDPDMLSFIERTRGKAAADVEGVHGCDGCCTGSFGTPPSG